MDINEEKNLNKKPRKKWAPRPVHYIAISFFALILLGSFFLSLPISHVNGEWFSYVDALFTSTSAVCVTGLTVVDTGATYSLFGQIVILILIQLGGLGIMTFTSLIFMLVGKRITLRERLLVKEAYSQEDLHGVMRTTKIIICTTFIIETIGAILLSITFISQYGFWKGAYFGIFHSVSAFCNAGFDVLGSVGCSNSITAFQSNVIVNLSIMSLIVLGGMGFMVIKDAITHRPSKWILHTKIVIFSTLFLIVVPAILFMLFEWNNPNTLGPMSFGEKLMAGFFQSVTTRTAGYATIDQGSITTSSAILSIILMFIGVAPASTGGGVKITTMVVMLFVLGSGVLGKREVVINKKQITEKTIIRATSITMFAVFLITMIAFLVSSIEIDMLGKDMTFMQILFETVSAFGTVGLSMGITGSFSIGSKLLLSLLMFLGRLGTVTLGLLCIGSNKDDGLNIKYSEATINLG